MIYKSHCRFPYGVITLCSDGERLTALKLYGDRYYDHICGGDGIEKDDLEIFEKTREWLDRYFGGQNPGIDELKLAPAGSSFRKRVWEILCRIPYGKVTTYKDIAREMSGKGEKTSARAVGNAIAHNPIEIIIPCHRVVGSDGSLTGYAGGIENKKKLLMLEGTDMSRLYVPKHVF